MAQIPRKSFRKTAFRGENPPQASESRAIKGEESWYIRPTRSGALVTPDLSSTIATVYAAIIVLAGDVGTMPFNVMRRAKNGSKTVDWADPAQDLIFFGPNDQLSAQAWRECSMWHCCTRGNAYSRGYYDGLGEFERFDLLDPDKVTPALTPAGELYYRVEDEKVPAAEVLHVRAPGYNGINGKSPILQCQESFGLTGAVEGYGQDFFGNGISPAGILSFEDDPDEDDVKEIRKSIEDRHAGARKAHRLMVLTGNAKFAQTSIPPEQAQFLLTRRFQLEEVCRIFRIPPSKLQSFDKTSFASLEELNLDYYTSSLLPWLTRFEMEWVRKLYTRKQRRAKTIEHDQTHLLKGRMLDQANVWKILKELGVVCSNQIAASYGFAPHQGGDSYLVQLNQGSEAAIGSATLADLKGVKPAAGSPNPADPPADPAGRSRLIDLALEDLDRYRTGAP